MPNRKTTRRSVLTDRTLIDTIIHAAQAKMAADIQVIDVQKISSVTSYFVILTANSAPHLNALADGIEKAAHGINLKVVRGGDLRSGWIIVDLATAVVHVMLARERAHYNLEELWGRSGIIYHE